ncbi:FMN reductase [Embleya scabrispora]|uniref:FMN reductase n=1 Tax=Embleya scabrispora TaxID=159449 RepID=UPI0003630DEA|nr:FMN reductase [Embleya scabrispora]MYS86384.1 oxidoreductase [Streptomyces sp. SID5474]
MAQPVKLVVVSAGLGKPSSTRMLGDRLAEATGRQLLDRGVEADVHTVELRDVAVDIAHNLVTGFPPPGLRAAIETVTRADALIAVTPIFTASYSGLFKSFFDVLDNSALTGKPVLIAATGGTARHSLALEHALRPLFAYLRATVTPTSVYAATGDWGASAGAGDDLAARIARAGGELADLAAGLPRAAAAPAAEFEEVVPFAEQLAALRRG